jgi:hypothetical protein
MYSYLNMWSFPQNRFTYAAYPIIWSILTTYQCYMCHLWHGPFNNVCKTEYGLVFTRAAPPPAPQISTSSLVYLANRGGGRGGSQQILNTQLYTLPTYTGKRRLYIQEKAMAINRANRIRFLLSRCEGQAICQCPKRGQKEKVLIFSPWPVLYRSALWP